MKVLFVASSRKGKGISPFIRSQGESLVRNGIALDYFLITGSGIFNYIKAVFKLRAFLKNKDYDIIHAHYNFCGIVSYYAKNKERLITSFMGDDLYGTEINGKQTRKGYLNILLANIFSKLYPNIIVKSLRMKKMLSVKDIKKVSVVANGVDYNKFHLININKANEILGLEKHKKYVLFLGSKKSYRKNYKLFSDAMALLKNNYVVELSPYPIDSEKVFIYLNAVDVLVHTSFMEGSPNVIKEAMACNCPIVATDVGDVREVIGNTAGCFVSTFDPRDVAEKIIKAIEFNGRTTGRDDIRHLEINLVAKKIIKIYEKIVKE